MREFNVHGMGMATFGRRRRKISTASFAGFFASHFRRNFGPVMPLAVLFASHIARDCLFNSY